SARNSTGCRDGARCRRYSLFVLAWNFSFTFETMRHRSDKERVRNKRNETEKTEKKRGRHSFSVNSVSFRLFRTLSFCFQVRIYRLFHTSGGRGFDWLPTKDRFARRRRFIKPADSRVMGGRFDKLRILFSFLSD